MSYALRIANPNAHARSPKKAPKQRDGDGYGYQDFYLRYEDLQNQYSQLATAADALYNDLDEVMQSLPEDDPAYPQFETLIQNVTTYTS